MIYSINIDFCIDIGCIHLKNKDHHFICDLIDCQYNIGGTGCSIPKKCPHKTVLILQENKCFMLKLCNKDCKMNK